MAPAVDSDFAKPKISHHGIASGRPPTLLNRAIVGMLALTALLAGLTAALIWRGAESFQGVAALDARQAQIVEQMDDFSTVRAALGYGAFIHDFKNGVLRTDPGRIEQARAALGRAMAALDDLDETAPEISSQTAVLRDTLSRYAAMTDRTEAMIAAGRSAREIDAAVKVDDGPAEAALAQIDGHFLATSREMRAAVAAQGRYAQNSMTLTIVVAVGLGLLTAGLAVFGLIARRGAAALSGAYADLQEVSETMALQLEALAIQLPPSARAPPGSDGDNGLNPLDRLETGLHSLVQRVESQQAALARYTRELEEANGELTRFAFVASHDLQEPLRKIQSNIDLIERRCADQLTDDVAERLERIARAATAMRQLIDDLLSYSRATLRELSFEPVPLADLVHAAAEETRCAVEEAGGTMTLSLADGPRVQGDAMQLRQSVLNLLNNAVKYRPPESPPDIAVTLTYTAREAVLSVADRGIGFDPAYAEQIFEPFRRLHGRSSAYSGSGVGLSIVKRTAQRHGGSVRAEPRRDGGAVFTLSLPLGGAAPEKEA